MATLHEVQLPADQEPQFPARCPGCGGVATEGFSLMARANWRDFVLHPAALLLWLLLGRRKRVGIKTCRACRRRITLRQVMQIAGVAIGMLSVVLWMFARGHFAPDLLTGLGLLAVLAFFLVPVVLILVDGVMAPFVAFSLRKGRLSYLFTDEQFARDFATCNGREVEE